MHKHTRHNEELIHRPRSDVTSVIGRKKHTLFRARLLTAEPHMLNLYLHAANERNALVRVSVFMPQLRMLKRNDEKKARDFEGAIVEQHSTLHSPENLFYVLPPSKQSFELMAQMFRDYGGEFAPKNPIIYSYNGSILTKQPKPEGEHGEKVNRMLFAGGLELFDGNADAIRAFRQKLARKGTEAVFVDGLGPSTGPVFEAVNSIKGIRDRIKIRIHKKDSEEAIAIKKNAFVIANPLVAKEITEL